MAWFVAAEHLKSVARTASTTHEFDKNQGVVGTHNGEAHSANKIVRYHLRRYLSDSRPQSNWMRARLTTTT